MMPYREGLAKRTPDQEVARAAVERDLASGEKIVWADRPKRGVVFQTSDIPLTGFFLVWTSFAVFWEVSAIAMGAPILFCLFGVPFILIGLYMLIGRYFTDARSRERTFYAVTDRRVIVVTQTSMRDVKTFDFQRIAETSVEERSDGYGNIYLGPRGYIDARGRNRPNPPAMALVPNVAEVYRLLNDTRGQ